jgi:hypothetical protein
MSEHTPGEIIYVVCCPSCGHTQDFNERARANHHRTRCHTCGASEYLTCTELHPDGSSRRLGGC